MASLPPASGTRSRSSRARRQRTIYHCWRFADRFLQFRFGGKTRDLHKIAPTDIVRFMQHLVARGKPFRDKTPPTHLRNFFQFLFKSGRTNINLAPSVPRIAQRYGSTLPRYLTPDQAEVVIAAVKADTALGRRHSTAMDLLQNGVDRTVIALWLGHESVETTQIYMHADMRLKEKALARVASTTSRPGRYRPDDALLSFLESL